MRVFLGITGASGAPYAARLLQALAGAGCRGRRLRLRARGSRCSRPSCYGDPKLDRDEVLGRLVGDAKGVTVYAPDDWSAPYASGSAQVDAYVICPCSMATVGTISSGAMDNLIHRAASVALKEGRRLVLMPRETPLSAIHLQGMLTLRQAGRDDPLPRAGLLPCAAVDRRSRGLRRRTCTRPDRRFQRTTETMGGMSVNSGTLPPSEVRRMFDRISPVYDVMNRVMTAGLDRRWRQLTVDVGREARRPRPRRVLRDGRSRARRAGRRRRRHGSRLLARDARPRPPQVERHHVDRGRRPRRCRSRTRASTRSPSASGSATSPSSRPVSPRSPACSSPAVGSAASRSRSRAALLRPFFRLWFDGVVPLLGKVLPGGDGLRVPARPACAASPGPGSSRPRWTAPASRRSAGGCSPAASSRSTRPGGSA